MPRNVSKFVCYIPRKIRELPVYIESPNYISPSGLTVQEKLELLKAGQEDLSNTFRGLETIARLKDKINDDSAFQNVLKHEERLQKIERAFENIVQRSQNVHQRAGLLTEKYDNIVNNLCEKMIVWNNFLTKKIVMVLASLASTKRKSQAPTMMRLSPPRLWHLIMNL